MFTVTREATGSLFLATLVLLATPFFTWIVWEFSKKKTSFFKRVLLGKVGNEAGKNR